MKLVSYLVLVLFAFVGYTQVVFFGNPEPVSPLNSPSGENYLYLDKSGRTVYFSREKHSGNVAQAKDEADIWKSSLDSGWTSPVNMKFNDKHFTSPLGVTADGRYFLYNKVWFDKSRFYGGVFGVSLSETDKEIGVHVPYLKNMSPLQTGSLSSDGRYMLLSLENNAGYGVDDLFVSFLQDDGSWSPVRNLGRNINTEFQELTPFIAADNRTLFFATNGRGGEGSFDLYKSTRLDDTWQSWTKPENLGSAVNTSGSETSFTFLSGADYAYFVSTQNSDGYGDIKRIKITADIEADTTQEASIEFVIEEEVASHPVTFQLLDSKTSQPLVGRVIIFGEDDSTAVATGDGGQLEIPFTGENVSLEFKSPGYLSARLTVDQSAFMTDTSEVRDVRLEPLEAGNTITLQHVLFYRGTANFIEGSERELDLVVEMMQENPEVDIFLKGHTDNVGNPVLNVQLSQARVESVKEFLVTQGIAADRITGKGFGGDQPLAPNDSEETRKLNRRVEFEIKRD